MLYDGHDGRNGAMVAWALEYLGRDDVHIMEVFFDRWKDQGREVFYRPVPTETKHFTARVNPGLRASIDDISGAPDLKLVDTRSREEYNGETETDEKPGHIPGAVNIVWQDLLGEDGQVRIRSSICCPRHLPGGPDRNLLQGWGQSIGLFGIQATGLRRAGLRCFLCRVGAKRPSRRGVGQVTYCKVGAHGNIVRCLYLAFQQLGYDVRWCTMLRL